MIRPAGLADMAAIAAIYGPLVETSVITFETDPPSAEEMARRWQDLEAGGFPYLVAETGGHVHGYAYAGPFRTRAAYRYCVENSVYIAQGAQRGGLGAALMAALVDACQAKGFTQMLAIVTDAPDTAYSLAFHQAIGFEKVGKLSKAGFKFRRWLDVAVLQRPL